MTNRGDSIGYITVLRTIMIVVMMMMMLMLMDLVLCLLMIAMMVENDEVSC